MNLEDTNTGGLSEKGPFMTPNGVSTTRHIPVLRLAVLSFFTAVLLLQILGTMWSLLAIRQYPRARSGLPPYNGTWYDVPAIRAAGGVPFLASLDSTGPAARLGLREGDLIVAVNGIALKEHPEAYFRALLRSSPGDSLRVTWVRGADRHSATIGLEELTVPRGSIYRNDISYEWESASTWWNHVGPMVMFDIAALLLGIIIGFLRLRDTVAFRLATALLTTGTLVFSSRIALSSLWPEWVRWPAYFCAFASIAVMGPMWIGSMSVFPVRTRMGAWLLRRWWLFWIVYGAWALGDTLEAAGKFYPSLQPAATALRYLQTRSDSWPMALLVLLAIPLIYAHRHAIRQRRIMRVKVFQTSSLLLLTGAMLYLPGVWYLFDHQPWYYAVPYGFMTLSGVVLGYSIVAERLFDIRFVIRRGLQHLLLSRGMLFGEFVLLFFVILQTLRNARFEFSQSMIAVSALALMGSTLIVIGLRRANRPLMAAIDQHFFREAYDARRVLVGLGEQVSTLTLPEEILRRAGEALLNTLHPARVGFLMVENAGGEAAARLAWGRWQKRPGSRVAAPTVTEEYDSTPVDLARVKDALDQMAAGRPWVDFPPTREEADAPMGPTKSARYELVLPVRAGHELMGCLALAVKLSEQPYSREDKELLQGVAQAVGMALRNAALVEVAKREARQARDLEIARGVQQRFFPRSLPSVPGWEFAAACLPAQAVGGDFYDLFEVETGKVAFAVGDVSGKGLGASLLTANLHALMRSLLPRASADLGAFMMEVNQHLVDASPAGMFVTLFVGVLDTATGELRYVNGGHPPALVYSGMSHDVKKLETGGMLVGAVAGMQYDVGAIQLHHGDVLATYSDGVTEAVNTAEEMYEEARLVAALAASRSGNASAVFSGIITSVQDFSRGTEQADDITLVVIRRIGDGAGAVNPDSGSRN
jgi:sigma-B regulation protein RsbU (phosphoserine phosphatase)